MRFVAIAAWVVGLVALAAWQTVHLPDGNPVSDVLVLPGTRYVAPLTLARPGGEIGGCAGDESVAQSREVHNARATIVGVR